MTTEAHLDEAIETLQQLGLKEYEARCFVGLSRLTSGTAKTLSEITDVPRTRVYDAIRVLETKGLVEVHHSSPQQFRAVSIAEAIETLREQYESRLGRVKHALEEVEPVEADDDSTVQEVWSINGAEATENRTTELVRNATGEVVIVVGDESVLTEDVVEVLRDRSTDIDLLVGSDSDALRQTVEETIPGVSTVASGLDWLHPAGGDGRADFGRLILVDRSAVLVSSLVDDTGDEQAIYGEGFGNGFVVLTRRLIAHGPLADRDGG